MNNFDYSSDYDFTGTVFSTDPGVHNDRPRGRVQTREEKEAAALAKARREYEHYPEEAPDEDMEEPGDD